MTADEQAWAVIAEAVEEAITVPGQSALNLHELRTTLGSCWEAAGHRQHDNDGHRQCSYYWRSLSQPARERLVLECLGNSSLNTGQLAVSLVGHKTYRETVATVLKALMAKGEVQREQAPGWTGGAQAKWLYSRSAELRGAIAELERAFEECESLPIAESAPTEPQPPTAEQADAEWRKAWLSITSACERGLAILDPLHPRREAMAAMTRDARMAAERWDTP
jgi:hypothetical protein